MAHQAPTLDGSTIEEEVIQTLRATMRGQVLLPRDAGFDEARVLWNTMIDKTPGLIARCTGVADVINAVNVARKNGFLVAVRGGGHNWAGLGVADGGILIDLSLMKGIRVDPKGRTAEVQGGVIWGELDHECQAFGLAVTGGHVSTTGVAGLTLGGGIGWLCRKIGLTVDNLISADVVTADGSFLTASASENKELFWGIRGGGGNFGIATSFTFRLHPVHTVVGGMALWPADQASKVLQFYREYITTAPDELTTAAGFLFGPPAPFLPTHLHGAPLVAIVVCYAGDVDEGLQVLQPVKAFGPPAVDLIGPMPYLTQQTLLDGILPPNRRYYIKSVYLDDLSDDAITTLVAHSAAMTSPLSLVTLQHYQGAVSRNADNDTAYSYRNAAFAVTMGASWLDPREDDRHVRWSRAFYEAMLPLSDGVYVNFMGPEEGEDRVRAAYGEKTYDRLVVLKNKYDPTNLFRVNHNIRPTVTA